MKTLANNSLRSLSTGAAELLAISAWFAASAVVAAILCAMAGPL